MARVGKRGMSSCIPPRRDTNTDRQCRASQARPFPAASLVPQRLATASHTALESKLGRRRRALLSTHACVLFSREPESARRGGRPRASAGP
eukprot:scaffold109_cov252-Pinguiococcus_pyrenoidosus.AAC.90